MESMFPKFVVLHPLTRKAIYIKYYDDGPTHRSKIGLLGQDVLEPLLRIELEWSKQHPSSSYVNLRFVHTNRYWSVNPADSVLYARSDQPDEDLSSPSCTLFRVEPRNNEIYLFHADTIFPVTQPDFWLKLEKDPRVINDPDKCRFAFNWVNADELVHLPKLVAFRGSSGKFLKSVQLTKDHPYLQFSAGNCDRNDTGHQVFPWPQGLYEDGCVLIKSVYFDKWWRLSPTWIWPDTYNERDEYTYFKPIKVGERIVLKSHGNKLFCRRLTADGKSECLNANVATMAEATELEVVELVSQSKVYDVRFKTEFAGVVVENPNYVFEEFIFDNTDNDNDKEFSATLSETTNAKSEETVTNYMWGGSSGIQTTFDPDGQATKFVKVGLYEFRVSISGMPGWGRTREEKTVGFKMTVSVPKRSRAVWECVGSKVKCVVPFNYTRDDTSSVDGTIATSKYTDGLYTSIQYFHIKFNLKPNLN